MPLEELLSLSGLTTPSPKQFPQLRFRLSHRGPVPAEFQLRGLSQVGGGSLHLPGGFSRVGNSGSACDRTSLRGLRRAVDFSCVQVFAINCMAGAVVSMLNVFV